MEVRWKQHSFCSSCSSVASASSALVLLTDKLLHIQQIHRSCSPSSDASVYPAGDPSSSAPRLKARSKEQNGSQGCFPLNVGGKCLSAPLQFLFAWFCFFHPEVFTPSAQAGAWCFLFIWHRIYSKRVPQIEYPHASFVRLLMLLWQLDKSHDK